jgi:hypothetical protein
MRLVNSIFDAIKFGGGFVCQSKKLQGKGYQIFEASDGKGLS